MNLSSNDLNQIKSHLIYCPRCKTCFVEKDKNLKVCNNCHLHFYINPVVTNGLIAKDKSGDILLVKRKVDPKKGYWDIPGGFVDLNETLEESLIREIKEELGIELKNFHYLTSKKDLYEYNGIYYQTLGEIFEGTIPENETIIVSDDVDGYQFFSKSDFPLDRLAFESQREFFKQYLSN